MLALDSFDRLDFLLSISSDLFITRTHKHYQFIIRMRKRYQSQQFPEDGCSSGNRQGNECVGVVYSAIKVSNGKQVLCILCVETLYTYINQRTGAEQETVGAAAVQAACGSVWEECYPSYTRAPLLAGSE